ncbi:MAG: transglutaminase TgpA family protein [Acidimicrobiia bacterium]
MTRALEPAEDSKSFRVAVLAALVAAGCAVLQQGVGGGAARVVVLVGYPVAFLIAYATRHHRPALLRIVVTAAGFLVIMTFAASLSGQPLGGFAALQVPLAEVFLWLLLVHAIDSPGRRALLITLLSSAVLMAVAGVLSLTMAIVPFLILWVVASITALVLGQRALLHRLPELAPPSARRKGAALGTATAVLVALVIVAVLGTGVFMVAPVAGTNRSLTFPAELPKTDSVPVLGGLSNPSLGAGDPAHPAQGGNRGSRASFGYFGFSTELDTATRGRPDNTLVMRVRASSPDYWRAQSFDSWDGRVWRASRTRPSVVRGEQPIQIPRAADDGPSFGIVGTDELVQTYYIERPGPNAIFAAAAPVKLFFSDRAVFQLPDGSLRAGVQLDQGSVYTVVSRRSLATAGALRASNLGPAPASILARYAAAPITTDRVRALAAAVTANAPTSYDKVLALEAWMGSHTKYTLDIPPLPKGEDAVDRFLFVDRRGFCEQIGTSLVVMLRSLGIPARLAVGYATGERNPFTGLYEVRAKDAHAWAEVYFPGVGWQAFDPTAHVPLAGNSTIDAAGAGTLAYLNARIDIPAWAPVVIGGLLLAIGFVMLARVVVRRRRNRRDRVEPSWAATRLDQLEQLGTRRGRARSPGETTPEYAHALARLDPLAAHHLLTIAHALDAAMFSGRPPEPEDRARIDEALADLGQRWQGRPQPAAPVLVDA